jgi:hypothetical protein
MRTLGLTLLLAGLLLAEPAKDAKDDVKPGKNLVPNGDFEKGTDTPEGWQQVDGLTTWWIDDPDKKRGKIIKFDTDVLQSQGYEWWAQIATGKKRAKDAPKKLPTTPPKYDTLAGLDGVWYWSDFIEIEKGKAYWLTLDYKGTPDVMAWLVGYEKKESNAFGADAYAFQEYLKEKTLKKPLGREKRNHETMLSKYVYRAQHNQRYAKALPDGWKRMTRDAMPCTPTKMTPKVKFVRVLVYPFWPPGEMYLDNVRLVEVPYPDGKKP